MLKSLAIQLFGQQFVQANNKKMSKLCITVPLWGESTSVHWIPITKGQSCWNCVHFMTSSWGSDNKSNMILPHLLQTRHNILQLWIAVCEKIKYPIDGCCYKFTSCMVLELSCVMNLFLIVCLYSIYQDWTKHGCPKLFKHIFLKEDICIVIEVSLKSYKSNWL